MSANVRYNNLTGGLNTVQGINTINQSIKRTETPEMYNVEYYKLGGLSTMQGNRLFGTQFNTSISLGYEYIYGNDKYLIVCTTDGRVHIYNKLTNSYDVIYEFPTATQRHSICSFNNGIVISNGIDDLVYYQYNRNQLLSGSVTLNNETNTITGEGTSFTTELSIGDYITFTGIEGKYKVTEITNDTSLTVDRNIEVTATQTYYAYSYNTDIYYTTQNTNGTKLTVYSIDENNKLTIVSEQGSINGEVLTVPTTTTQTVQGTRYDSWTQPAMTSNTSFGTISNYNLCNDNGVAINSSSYSMEWTFPNDMELDHISFNYILLGNSGGSFSAEVRDENGTLIGNTARIGVANSNVAMEVPFINKPITNKISVKFIFQPASGGVVIANVNMLTLYAKQPVSYNYEETVIVNKTYNRLDTGDKTVTVSLTGVNYYLSDLSELNATYVNEDDPNINRKVRGLALMSYQGRIFVGANDGTLYYSEVGLIHGWDVKYGAGAIPTFYDDNSDFTALGTFDKYLIICKRERSYLLDGTSTDDTNWTINPYSEYTCDSQQSWLVCNNMFLVYSRNAGGIYPLLQRTIYSPNYQGNELSVKIRDSFNNLSRSRYDYIFPVYNPKKKYIMFYVPMISGNGSNYCYIYDLQTKTWLLRIVPQNVTCAFRYDNEIYIATQDGLILKEFSGSTFNGEAIEFSWKSPWFSFGDGSNYLSTREFRVNLSEEGANNFQIRTRRDGIDSYKTRKINSDSSNYIGLEWEAKEDEESLTDTLWDEDSWTATKHTIKRFPLPNQYFQTIQVEFYGNSTEEAMNIYGFEFHGINLEEVPY